MNSDEIVTASAKAWQVDKGGILQFALDVFAQADGSMSYPYLTVRVAPLDAPEGQVNVWQSSIDPQGAEYGLAGSGEWVLQADHRLESLYLKSDGNPYAIASEHGDTSYSGVGSIPDWLTREPRPSVWHRWVDDGWVLDEQAERDDKAAAALAQRAHLMTLAMAKIAPLADAVDLGEATPEEEALLLQWRRYRVHLNRLETQPGFPLDIQWPQSPDEV